MDTKRCPRCGQDKPATLEHFPKNSAARSGLGGYCKVCNRERVREWNANNAERHKAGSRRWYQEHSEQAKARTRQWKREHPEKIRQYKQAHRAKYPEKYREYARAYFSRNQERMHKASRVWAAANRERNREHHRRYYARHREEYKKKTRQYQKRHPEKIRMYCQNRRARELGAGGSWTAQDIVKLRALQKDRCWWCGKKIKKNKYHIDHRIPLSKGGSNELNNLVISCPTCNLSKHDKLPEDFNGRLL